MKISSSKTRFGSGFMAVLTVLAVMAFGCASKKAPTDDSGKSMKVNELTELKIENTDSETIIKISAKGELSPNVFKLTDPLRVIIDLTDTRLGDVKGPVQVNNGIINEITTSQFDDVTSSLSRIVVGFDKVVDYTVTPKDNSLTVSVPKGEGAAAAGSKQANALAPSPEEKEAAGIAEAPPVEPGIESQEGGIPEVPEAVGGETPSSASSELPSAEEKVTSPFPEEEGKPLEEQVPAAEGQAEVKPAKKIEDIQFETSDMGTSVYITADGDIGEWEDFVLEKPARLVIDLKGMKNAFKGRKRIDIGSGEVKQLRIGEYKDKIRIVMDYPEKAKPSYTINKENKRLVLSIFQGAKTQEAPSEVALGEAAPGAAPQEEELPTDITEEAIPEIGAGGQAPEPYVEETPAPTEEIPAAVKPKARKASITSIDFKQLADVAKSRLIIGTSDEVAFTTSEAGPTKILISLENTNIPKSSLKRFIDTSAFPSAVAMITPKYVKKGNSSQITVDLKEAVSYNAQQEGNQIYVDFDIPGHMAAAGLKESTVAQMGKDMEAVVPKEAPSENLPEEEVPAQVAPAKPEKPKIDDERYKWAAVKEEFLSDRLDSTIPLTEMGSVLAESYGGKQRFVGRRISLDFKNAELRSIFRLLAEVSKFNMIVGDDVQGKITVRLENVPWDQAFAIILQTKGLWYEKYGSIIRIAPAEKLRKEREMAAASQKAAIEAKPMDVLFKPISYATAGDIAQRVKPILSSRGTVDIDTRTNTLIIRDVKEYLEASKSLIEKLDTQTPQVSIEGRIVEATSGLTRRWGVKWGNTLSFSPATGNPTGLFFPNRVVSSTALEYPVSANAADNMAFNFGSINNMIDLDLAIQFAEQSDEAKLIGSPKVTVLDNASASIMSGVRIPYVTQTDNAGSNVRFENAVISLNVTPHITSDGAVFMKLDATRNEPAGDVENPRIIQRQITTEVLVKSGNTTVLGGVYKLSKRSGSIGVPGLKNLPVIGWLFGSRSKDIQKEELLIFITPRIVGDERAAVKDLND